MQARAAASLEVESGRLHALLDGLALHGIECVRAAHAGCSATISTISPDRGLLRCASAFATGTMVVVSAFSDLDTLTAVRVWEGVVGRVVGGDQVTVAVIELDPGSVVPEHSHAHEQIGVCVAGSLDFRVGDERREVGPGETWWIPGGAPHEVRTGPAGAVVVETWAPKRDDWAELERLDGVRPRWPE